MCVHTWRRPLRPRCPQSTSCAWRAVEREPLVALAPVLLAQGWAVPWHPPTCMHGQKMTCMILPCTIQTDLSCTEPPLQCIGSCVRMHAHSVWHACNAMPVPGTERMSGLMPGLPPACDFFLGHACNTDGHLYVMRPSSSPGCAQALSRLRGSPTSCAQTTVAGYSGTHVSDSSTKAGVGRVFQRRSEQQLLRGYLHVSRADVDATCLHPSAGMVALVWPEAS